MRIKKTSNTRAIAGKVVNVASESTIDAYSCDYINDCNTYSANEVNTGKTWIDGKPIYRKCISKSVTARNQTVFNIGNLGVVTNCQSYLDRGTYKNINNWGQDSTDFGTVYVSDNNIMYNGSYAGTLYITVEYTKTTD